MHSDLPLRGIRLGAPNWAAIRENEDVEPAPRLSVQFSCPKGHKFDVAFAVEADLPDEWECRSHGTQSERLGAGHRTRKTKPPRTHWDMLLERRSVPELEVLLAERLAVLRGQASSSVVRGG